MLGRLGWGLYLEASEEALSSSERPRCFKTVEGRGPVGSLFWSGGLSSSQKEGGFGSVVEWHLVKKTTKGKWGGLGFHLKNCNLWVKKLSAEGT